ncbi:MAG TPA: hypothetical protein VF200_06605 [Woeseiaceae bacterium]
MPPLRTLPCLLALALAALALPPAARAALDAADLPGAAEWYLHADLAAMRQVDSGRAVYRWLEEEVFADIRKDVGIDLGREVDTVTAFADPALGTVLVVDGPISRQTRDKLLALATLKARLETVRHDGATYYHVLGAGAAAQGHHAFGDLDDSAWFTFDVRNKLIVTSEEEPLKALIESGGRIAGSGGHAGSLFVLTADKEFVQAGAVTAKLSDDDTDWDSNILRNTEKAALLVSDSGGLLALEARLVSKDPSIARSLGGIINGLLGLQAFNDDLDPEVLGIVQNTKVEILDNVLSISTVFDPEVVGRFLE